MGSRHTYPERGRGARTRAWLGAGLLGVVFAGCSGNIGAPSAQPSSSAAAAATAATAAAESSAPSASPATGPITLTFTPFPLWTGVTGSEADGQPQDYWDKL